MQSLVVISVFSIEIDLTMLIWIEHHVVGSRENWNTQKRTEDSVHDQRMSLIFSSISVLRSVILPWWKSLKSDRETFQSELRTNLNRLLMSSKTKHSRNRIKLLLKPTRKYMTIIKEERPLPSEKYGNMLRKLMVRKHDAIYVPWVRNALILSN